MSILELDEVSKVYGSGAAEHTIRFPRNLPTVLPASRPGRPRVLRGQHDKKCVEQQEGDDVALVPGRSNKRQHGDGRRDDGHAEEKQTGRELIWPC